VVFKQQELNIPFYQPERARQLKVKAYRSSSTWGGAGTAAARSDRAALYFSLLLSFFQEKESKYWFLLPTYRYCCRWGF